MTPKNKAAKLLGSITTAKKIAAARENGKKGGRPRHHLFNYTHGDICGICGRNKNHSSHLQLATVAS